MKHKKKQHLTTSGGFSLIEILVVIIILGIMATIVVPKVFKHVEKSKTTTAKIQIEKLGAALDSFRLDNGRYPTTNEGLKALRERPAGLKDWDGPYFAKPVPPDPWDRAYHYRCPGDHGDYDLYTYGRDGVEGGEKSDQDVVSWK